MSVDPPRHLPPTPEERLRTVVSRMAGGSNAGQTRFARPVPPPVNRRPEQAAGVDTKPDRLTAYANIPTASLSGASGQHDVQLADWGLLVDEGGSSIGLGPYAGYDGIYVYEPGMYAVNLTVYVPGVYAAANSMMLQLGANISEFNNTPTATWHGDEAISGDTPFASGSLTNFFDGRGLSGGVYVYLLYKNIDAATVTVGVNVEVVKLS